MPSGGPNKTTSEKLAKWEAMLDEGYGYKHVAEIYQVAPGTIRKYLPGRGWTRKQITEHGTFMKHHNEKMRKIAYV